MDKALKDEFERINKKLNALAAAQRKDTWVNATWVMKATGWDFREMAQARKQNIVEYKRGSGGGYLYKLESIPDIFIKQKQAS
jgi:hypothetical protein